jgi:hypothetical protein
MLTPADQGLIRALLGMFQTAYQAKDSANDAGFALTPIDARTGRILTLSYRGVEVAVLFKRQCTIVELGVEGAPVLQTKDLIQAHEEWVLWNLLDANTPEAGQEDHKLVGQLQSEVRQLQGLNVHLQRESDAKSFLVAGLERKLEDFKAAFQGLFTAALAFTDPGQFRAFKTVFRAAATVIQATLDDVITISEAIVPKTRVAPKAKPLVKKQKSKRTPLVRKKKGAKSAAHRL